MNQISVRAPRAEAVTLCLFDGEAERSVAMVRRRDLAGRDLGAGNLGGGDDWVADAPPPGTCYGLRAHGTWAPDRGLWFDPAKLLVDPRAVELDQPFAYSPALSAYGVDTAALVPRAVMPGALPDMPRRPPCFRRGGLIYEVNVRGLTMLHPDVPAARRGTVAALAHPAVLAHLEKLHVSAVELMPITAWIDERHLPSLGLSNAWGYNPVVPMALDPRLCPGGVAELRETVAALHARGIGMILDLVFNHTGESDVLGPVISFRGMDNAAYAHAPDGALINDSGCGNTLDFANPAVRVLVLDSLRHFVRHCGIDGFRFDLAPVMARGPGFAADAPIFAEIAADPWLADRVLIAEPWDIGPGGYQLGRFPASWLEWNDRYRDDVRRFWRGDCGIGTVAQRIAGSSDVFGKNCRSVNFLAAHDGFTLADTLAYAQRHNHANGEDNRDGHSENFSWNNGAEGPAADPAILARRAALARAMLGTLFVSAGTIQLTAGDEFGRSQRGNNNAYAQDNALTWIDWEARDTALEDHVAALAAWRAARDLRQFPDDGAWTALDGAAMDAARWEDPATPGFVWRDGQKTAQPAGLRVDRAALAAGPEVAPDPAPAP